MSPFYVAFIIGLMVGGGLGLILAGLLGAAGAQSREQERQQILAAELARIRKDYPVRCRTPFSLKVVDPGFGDEPRG